MLPKEAPLFTQEYIVSPLQESEGYYLTALRFLKAFFRLNNSLHRINAEYQTVKGV